MKFIGENVFASEVTPHVWKNFRRYASSIPAVALVAVTLTGAKLAHAATVNPFLIATHTTPASGGTAPFSITTNRVYELGLNPENRVATSAVLVDNFTFDVQTALTFNNDNYNNGVNFDATDFTDQGEPRAGTAALVNAEVASWDNVNVPGRIPDLTPDSGDYAPAEQIDFGRNAPVIFNPVAGGFTDLVIAELGGFNPFELWLCEDAECNVSEQIFRGINRLTRAPLLQTSDFAISDTAQLSELDTSWLFRFSEPVFDFVRVLENDTRSVFTNERLQVDFIGVGGVAPPAVVPLPTSLPLLAGGLGLLGFVLRRRKV